MRFEFAIPSRIIFGEGTIEQLASIVSPWGRRALWVVGASAERTRRVKTAVEAAGIGAEVFHCPHEPSTELIENGMLAARNSGCDMVISIGGGSAIDTGKAIAALLPNQGEITDYLEVVGKGLTLQGPALSFVAVPTTAGTGSEVTRNAVMTVSGQRVKVSLRAATLLPRLAIVDPELTYAMPPAITASSGLDALVQLIEPFVSTASNPFTDALCREGIPLVVRSLLAAYQDGSNSKARADMSLAALLSGMTLSNAKLGAVHGLSGPIGGLLAAPHGAIGARLLPLVVAANIRALREREPDSQRLVRYEELGRMLTGNSHARAEDAVGWLDRLCAQLEVKPLGQYGMSAADFPGVIERAGRISSMKGNPVTLTESELAEILERAL